MVQGLEEPAANDDDLSSQNPHDERRELALASCLLTANVCSTHNKQT